jgi:hypothetical protein
MPCKLIPQDLLLEGGYPQPVRVYLGEGDELRLPHPPCVIHRKVEGYPHDPFSLSDSADGNILSILSDQSRVKGVENAHIDAHLLQGYNRLERIKPGEVMGDG